MSAVRTDDVRAFWNDNPLCASLIPFPLGSPGYFDYFDGMREAIDGPAAAAAIHEFADFAGRRVLDVGCGNGYVLSRYAARGADVFGVDLTPTAVDLCRKRFRYAGLAGDFREANAEELPFPDDFFDCVCSMGVLHHVPDTARAVAEIGRVLRPGGRLIVMFYHRNSAFYRVNLKLRSLLTGRPVQHLLNEYDGVGNPKGDVYSRAELGRLLGAFTGLEMRARYLEGYMVVPKLGRFIPKAALRPFERFWGFNLYAKGWKPGPVARSAVPRRRAA